MSQVLAVVNQKGGVGKTTTAVNLAASLAATKRRVLLIDLDPQGNATTGCGVDKHDLEHTLYDVLVGNCPVQQAIIHLPDVLFSLLPANGDLTAAEVELLALTQRESRLKSALQTVMSEYDYILIDCPPSLNMLTINALVASTGVIIPMQCEFYALEGLSALLHTIESIKQTHNPDLQISGILRTMHDPRASLTADVSAQLEQHFGKQVFNTVIPRNIRLAEAPSHGVPVLAYDKSSRGATAYLALAGEFLRRAQVQKNEKASTNE